MDDSTVLGFVEVLGRSTRTLGVLIVIEGIDGSGKGTQAKRLTDKLLQAGRSVKLLSFPRYDQTLFGKVIGDFLNGRFGQLDEVDPYLAALLYAGDRLESKAVLADGLATHDIVVCDRYVPSNIAHQAAKLDGNKRRELMAWIEQMEYDVFRLPRPDWTLLLDLPVSVATELIATKQKRSYTDRKADLQEADVGYLERVRDVYHELADSQPQWSKIDCIENGRLRTIDEVSASIQQTLDSLDLAKPNHAADSTP